MVHPDYQYDPTLLPQIIAPITHGEADIVLGSRLKSGSPIAQGIPWWKVFDQDIIAQAVAASFRITEISHALPPRGVLGELRAERQYGTRILVLLARYVLHRTGLLRQRRFESLSARHSRLS